MASEDDTVELVMTSRQEHVREIVNVMRNAVAELYDNGAISIEVSNSLFLTCDNLDTTIESALADAKRGVWEQAAVDVENPGEADEAAADEASCVELVQPHALTREQATPDLYAAEHIIINGSRNMGPWKNRYFVSKEDHEKALAQQAQEIERLKARLSAMTAERNTLQQQATWDAIQRKADQQQLAGLKAVIDDFCVSEGRLQAIITAREQEAGRLRRILRAILNADERGQGLPFQEAMQEAQRILKEKS